MNIHEILQYTKGAISLEKYINNTGIPLISFRNNRKLYHFLLDTGANKAIIDTAILKELTGVKILKEESASFSTANGKIEIGGPLKIPMRYAGLIFNIEFLQRDFQNTFETVERDTGLKVSGVIGVDFLIRYNYILDFEKMIAYIKK